MSQSPALAAGPGGSRADANLLRQFVMEYLQQHGFDKALQLFQQGLAEQGGGTGGGEGGTAEKDADGEDEGMAGGREAIFRAPGPVPLDSTLKRNIPQAQTVSASTMSEKITPEFEAQARYIIEQLQKRAEGKDKGDGDGDGDGEAEAKEVKDQPRGESLLDTSDRVEGYKRYRRWVDDGLDLWKPELDGLSFPLFAHTFLDLLHFGFAKTAREFFERYRGHHEALHPQDTSTLSSISDRSQISINSLCQRLLNDKYTVAMSRNSHDLLLQWLSGAGLEDEWESGMHSSAGRAKEAVKAIVVNRININVSNQPLPLDPITLASSSGLLTSLLPSTSPSLGTQSTSPRPLKLGPTPISEKLREQVVRTLRDEEEDLAQHPPSHPNGVANGNGNGNGHEEPDTNGDVDMSPSGRDHEREVKIEEEVLAAHVDGDLVSPEEAETHPPIPAVFRISDLKREIEAVKDRRKRVRLGPEGEDDKAAAGGSGSAILPSVVAFTVFDGGEGVSSVDFSGDSSLMAVGSPESCIRLWSLKGEKLKAKTIDPLDGTLTEDEGLPHRKLIGHSGPVYSLSFDPLYGSSSPPSSLLSSSQDGTIRLWSLDTYSNLVCYRGHGRDPVWDVEWGPLGVYFASGSRDRTAKLWSSDRVTPLRMYTGHLSDVNCVRFHPNSLYLATASTDASCRLWDVQRGACIRLFLGHTDSVTTMAVSPDGRTLASAGLDSSIWLWDLGSSRPIKRMTGHKAAIQSLAFSAESSVLVSGSLDSTVRCWDVKSAGGERNPTLGGIGGGAGATGGGVGATADAETRRGVEAVGRELGELPMGGGGVGMGLGEEWDESGQTADLLATFRTKRTPILKAHYTPRNLCMVAGTFVPPSNAKPPLQA